LSYRNCDGIEFLKSLPDKSVDGIFTDPPWGGRTKIMGQDKFLELIQAVDEECPRILKTRARVLLWLGFFNMGKFIRQLKNLEYRWMIFCEYIPPRYAACFEVRLDPILYCALPGDPWPRLPKEKRMKQIYRKCSTGDKDTKHPCNRPPEIVKRIIKDWFRPGEYIIDPFAGSDTTGVACRQLLNPYDTCEIDPEMYKTGELRNSQKFLFDFDASPAGRE